LPLTFLSIFRLSHDVLCSATLKQNVTGGRDNRGWEEGERKGNKGRRRGERRVTRDKRRTEERRKTEVVNGGGYM